jgi:hypothetical protein
MAFFVFDGLGGSGVYWGQGDFTVTLHEELQIGVESARLRAAGKKEEAIAMAKTRPMPPWMAKVIKEKIGLDFLVSLGWNMDDVEATYGKEWLEC